MVRMSIHVYETASHIGGYPLPMTSICLHQNSLLEPFCGLKLSRRVRHHGGTWVHGSYKNGFMTWVIWGTCLGKPPYIHPAVLEHGVLENHH